METDSSYLPQLLMIAGAFGLVLLNGFFVVAEFALVRVRPTRMEQLAQEGNRRAVLVRSVIQHLDEHLSACQLGVTLTSLGLGWIGEPAFFRLIAEPLRWLGGWVPGLGAEPVIHTLAYALAFATTTFLHIVVGELVPKTLSIVYTEQMALMIAQPFYLFYRLFRPAIRILNGMSSLLLRRFGVEAVFGGAAAHTDEELRMLVHSSAKGGYLDETERDILDNVFDFSERVVRQVMTPRNEMVCLYVEDPLEESLAVARREGYTRFPLCMEEKDTIVGMVHIKDLFARAHEIRDLREIARPVLEVPETVSIAAVMQQMQREHRQMAIVRDEYGGTAGLVTMEDIVEEIVGEINDEFDPVEEPEVARLAPDVYDVDGAMQLSDAVREFGMTVDTEVGVDTLGGYIVTCLGRQPEVGDRVDLGGFTAEVTAAEGFRIERIRLQRSAAAPEADPDEPADAESGR